MKLLITISILVLNISVLSGVDKLNTDSHGKQGKSYWIVYREDVNKVYHISQIINNDCNHCGGELGTAFGKYLVMNDYSTNPRSAMYEHDVSYSSMEKRRDARIYKYKQMGYRVVQHNFNYQRK